MIDDYIVLEKKFSYEDLVNKIKSKYYKEGPNFDINYREDSEENFRESLRKKFKNKDGNIANIINNLQEYSNKKFEENDLNKIRYMLYVLEKNIGGRQLKPLFDEEKVYAKYLGYDENSINFSPEYNIHLTEFRKALEKLIDDTFKKIIQQKYFDIKIGIEFWSSVEGENYIFGKSSTSKIKEELKKWYNKLTEINHINYLKWLVEIKAFNKFNIYELMYCKLLVMEHINNLNVIMDIINQFKSSIYTCNISKENSSYKLSIDNNKIKIKDLKSYMNDNLNSIAQFVYEKEVCSKEEKDFLLEQYKNVVLFNNVAYQRSLMIHKQEYENKSELDFIFIDFIIIFLREIILSITKQTKEEVKIRSASNKNSNNNKSHKLNISINNIWKKEIEDLTIQEMFYLKLMFYRSIIYYSKSNLKLEKFLQVLNKPFEIGKDIILNCKDPFNALIILIGFVGNTLNECK